MGVFFLSVLASFSPASQLFSHEIEFLMGLKDRKSIPKDWTNIEPGSPLTCRLCGESWIASYSKVIHYWMTFFLPGFDMDVFLRRAKL